MKIAVVHGLLRGGAARRLTGTVQALSTFDGIELVEFGLTGSSVVHAAAARRQEWIPRAPTRSRVQRPVWRYLDQRGVRTAWSQLWRDVNAWYPDLVFANPCADPGGAPPGLAAARAASVYYCDEPRRVDYEREAAQASRRLTRLPYAPMRAQQRSDERASVAAAGALATNSAFTAGRIAAAYGREATVVTPGIAPIFGPGPRKARDLVLSVGTLIPSKGHDLVVEGVARAGLDRPVVVVGPREDSEEGPRLRRLADRLGVDLTMRVGISDDELAELYRSALVTMYLARDEPLGLVSLESQACGTPVIVSAEGGLVETVEHGVGGYHVPRTAVGAAAGLERLLQPDELDRLAAGAERRVIPRDRDGAEAVLGLFRTVRSGLADRVRSDLG